MPKDRVIATLVPVLVRAETVTDDIATVAVSAGVLTGSGGRTSHAAVVARELGKPCLVSCDGLKLDLTARTARIGERLLSEGEVICLDAESGLVFAGCARNHRGAPHRSAARNRRVAGKPLIGSGRQPACSLDLTALRVFPHQMAVLAGRRSACSRLA